MKKLISIPQVVIIATIVSVFVLVLSQAIKNDNNAKIQYVMKLQKSYLEFNEALTKLADDKGCPDDLQCTGLFEKGTTDKSFGDELVKYFKVKKNCGIEQHLGCFPKKTNENYNGLSPSFYDLDEWAGYRFITNDGMAYYVWNYAAGCTENDSTGATGELKNACGEIYVDINGPQKGPNCMGRDTYNFWISNGKGARLTPMGGIDTKWTEEDWRWKNANTGNPQRCYPGDRVGWPCAGRIIEEGWKMNY